MDVIEWLNSNQGAVMALLTALYVVATASMMRSMSRSNRLAQLSLSQSMLLDRQRTRPYVVFDLDFGNECSGCVHAVLVNKGLTAAYNVKVSITPAIEVVWGSDSPRPSGLIELPMASMAPGHREVDFLDTIPGFHQRQPDASFRGELVYEDASGTRYREPISFDFNYRKHVGAARSGNMHDDLQQIQKQLSELTLAVRQLAAKR